MAQLVKLFFTRSLGKSLWIGLASRKSAKAKKSSLRLSFHLFVLPSCDAISTFRNIGLLRFMQKIDRQTVKVNAGLITAGSVALASISGAQLPADDPSKFQSSVRDASVADSRGAVQREELAGTESYQKVALVIEAPKFEKKEQKRFKEIALKRALGTVSVDENAEFLNLQQSRRRAEVSFDADGVLAEYRRRQLIIDVVELLNRHVSFFKAEDQERIRAFGNPH